MHQCEQTKCNKPATKTVTNAANTFSYRPSYYCDEHADVSDRMFSMNYLVEDINK